MCGAQMWAPRGRADASLVAQRVTLAPDKCHFSHLHPCDILQFTTKARLFSQEVFCGHKCGHRVARADASLVAQHVTLAICLICMHVISCN